MWDSLDLRSLATVNLNIGYETAGFSVKLESVLLMRYGIWNISKIARRLLFNSVETEHLVRR